MGVGKKKQKRRNRESDVTRVRQSQEDCIKLKKRPIGNIKNKDTKICKLKFNKTVFMLYLTYILFDLEYASLKEKICISHKHTNPNIVILCLLATEN